MYPAVAPVRPTVAAMWTARPYPMPLATANRTP